MPKFIEKRIWYIKDILTPDGKTFGYEEFQEYYNIKINFIDFFSITHAKIMESFIDQEVRYRESKTTSAGMYFKGT